MKAALVETHSLSVRGLLPVAGGKARGWDKKGSDERMAVGGVTKPRLRWFLTLGMPLHATLTVMLHYECITVFMLIHKQS